MTKHDKTVLKHATEIIRVNQIYEQFHSEIIERVRNDWLVFCSAEAVQW